MKTETLQLRISSEIKEALQVRAAAMGMSMSEYVRFIVLEEVRRPSVIPGKEK